MARMILSRRSMLRGLAGGTAVAVALPPLEAMLDSHGTAFAGGDPIPRRFGQWFFGNGVKKQHWIPSSTGTAWLQAPPQSLLPLEDAGVLDYVSVVSRTVNPFPWTHAHHGAYWSLMTASKALDNDGVPENEGGDYPSRGEGPKAIDVIVDALSPGMPFERVTAGISRGQAGAPGLTGDPESAHFNPQALYHMLFDGFDPDAEPVSPGLIATRKSVLDAVAADASSLRSKLGANDRARLDDHLERIAAIEASLGAIAGECMVPPDPGPRPADLTNNGEHLEEINEAMSGLVAYALACDLTRVFDLTYSRLQGYTQFWQLDIDEGHHDLGHNEDGDQPRVQQTIVYMMQHLGVLLAKLRAIPVGDDNLLDHCCIWVTSEQADPSDHSTFDTPTLVVGRSGGALRGGVHHDAGGDPNNPSPEALHAGVILTMMQALGMDATSFGVGIGQSSHVMMPLLA